MKHVHFPSTHSSSLTYKDEKAVFAQDRVRDMPAPFPPAPPLLLSLSFFSNQNFSYYNLIFTQYFHRFLHTSSIYFSALQMSIYFPFSPTCLDTSLHPKSVKNQIYRIDLPKIFFRLQPILGACKHSLIFSRR